MPNVDNFNGILPKNSRKPCQLPETLRSSIPAAAIGRLVPGLAPLFPAHEVGRSQNQGRAAAASRDLIAYLTESWEDSDR